MSELKLRWYQNEAVNELIKALEAGKHPLCILPTGSGKTLVICEFVKRLTNNNRILILSHVFEILKQNYQALSKYSLPCGVGLYSKGLNSTTITDITVAGIQSVWRHPDLFRSFNIILIDECHLIPMQSDTMYRSFLNALDASYVGLTATPYRTNHGLLNEGPDALFDHIAYELNDYERLIKEGYLSQLITKNTYQSLNPNLSLSAIRTTAGDYNTKDLSNAFDRKEITNKAIEEMIEYAKDLKLWMIFAIDIDHATHITEALLKNGISSVVVHSKIGHAERTKIIDDVKKGYYQAVVNINILTTGFDAPNIDLIAMLRPTKSPVLHVQAIGRGLRVAPGKKFCLVMDFAGNTERLGPIDNIQIKKQGKKLNTEIKRTRFKQCSQCLALNSLKAKNCILCDHLFPSYEKITKQASNLNLLSDKNESSLTQWVNVTDVTYSLHFKKGSSTSLRATYHTEGINKFSEWICYDHEGWPGIYGKKWVSERWINSSISKPKNVHQLLHCASTLKKPSKILIDNSNKYAKIKKYKFK